MPKAHSASAVRIGSDVGARGGPLKARRSFSESKRAAATFNGISTGTAPYLTARRLPFSTRRLLSFLVPSSAPLVVSFLCVPPALLFSSRKLDSLGCVIVPGSTHSPPSSSTSFASLSVTGSPRVARVARCRRELVASLAVRKVLARLRIPRRLRLALSLASLSLPSFFLFLSPSRRRFGSTTKRMRAACGRLRKGVVFRWRCSSGDGREEIKKNRKKSTKVSQSTTPVVAS